MASMASMCRWGALAIFGVTHRGHVSCFFRVPPPRAPRWASAASEAGRRSWAGPRGWPEAREGPGPVGGEKGAAESGWGSGSFKPGGHVLLDVWRSQKPTARNLGTVKAKSPHAEPQLLDAAQGPGPTICWRPKKPSWSGPRSRARSSGKAGRLQARRGSGMGQAVPGLLGLKLG